MKPRQIKLVHDGIQYTWDKVSAEKYQNFVLITNEDLNTRDYTASGFPFMLQVEPTSLCNLECTLCPTGRRELNRPYRHMRLNEFRSIIDDMERYLLFLVLWDWGEPLMNPELPSMIRCASERGIKTVTSTNAHFLNDESYIEELLNSGLTTLIVAVDSVSSDNYEIYRKSGDLDCVLGGLSRAVSIKKRIGSKTLINVRMVIMKQNEHEIAAIECMARDAGADVFTVKSLNPSCGIVAKDEELLPTNPQYRRYEYIPGTFERVRTEAICRRVWTMSNIFSNGDVVPCCYDFDSEMKVGNAFEKPFTQLWNSSAYSDLRKRIYNDMHSISKCNHCGVNFKLAEYGWFVKASDLRFGSGLPVSVDNPDFEIIRLTNKIFQCEETIATMKGQIAAIESSIGWRMIDRLRSMRNTVIPESTYLRLRKYLSQNKKKEA
jgi:radical SAM protein with 4Fe4S-binding SPASM domain